MSELLYRRIALGAALTVLVKEVLRESGDLESLVPTANIVASFNLVAQGTNFAGEGISIDLSEVATAFIQTGSLQGLPPPLDAIVG
jgi:hypothetical protein